MRCHRGTICAMSLAVQETGGDLPHIPERRRPPRRGRKSRFSPADVRTILRIAQPPLSLDAEVFADGGPLGGWVIDTTEPSLEETAIDRDERNRLFAALDRLPEHDRLVVYLHLGLDGREPQSFSDIARQCGISKETAKRHYDRAIARLQHPSYNVIGGDDGDGVEWRQRALCREIGPEPFFPSTGERSTAASRLCRRCEVSQDCGRFALTNNIPYGVWGSPE